MAEIIFIVIFLIPAILGLAEIIHTVKLSLVSSDTKNNNNFVIAVLEDESFVGHILNVIQQQRWHGTDFAKEIILVNSNLKPENKKECKLLVSGEGIKICSWDDLIDNIIKFSQNQE